MGVHVWSRGVSAGGMVSVKIRARVRVRVTMGVRVRVKKVKGKGQIKGGGEGKSEDDGEGQVRVCAPSAPALQVLQCKLYLVSGKISDEGEKFGSVTELATSTTPTLIVPSVRFCFCFFFSFWGQY